MQIELVSKTPQYMKKIWVAARTCYSDDSPIELFKKEPSEAEMMKLVNHVISNKHHSVLEHCHMTFAVKNVSRTLLAQYSRHRIGVSLSVQSQRYVSEQSAKNENGIFDYVVPKTIEKNHLAKEKYVQIIKDVQKSYDELKEMGIPSEDARFVLPGGAGTNFVTSLNLRSFLDIYEKRVIAKGAQWEIKEFVEIMGKILIKEEPWLSTYIK